MNSFVWRTALLLIIGFPSCVVVAPDLPVDSNRLQLHLQQLVERLFNQKQILMLVFVRVHCRGGKFAICV